MTETAPLVTDQEQSTRGAGVMLSYRELVEIRTQQATMLGKLDAALMLQGKVDSIDRRVNRLERVVAGDEGLRAGEKKTWNTVLGFVAGAVVAAIPVYLPMLFAMVK